MNDVVRDAVRRQLTAAIDAMENTMDRCPDDVWAREGDEPQIWYLIFHTLFLLDHALTEDPATFVPPEPFGMEELDPAGVMPPRAYTKDELRILFRRARARVRGVVAALTEENAADPRALGSRFTGTRIEQILYNMRHVQHHTGQINLLLRQRIGDATGWVAIGDDAR
jgi:hypothetical protein